MALPIIDLPTFELTLPSTGQTIRYRPFTVKEEKILLIAQESKDSKQVLTAIRQVITNCIVDPLDIDTLPSFDLEFILLNLRAKSVNDIIEFEVTDPDTEEKVALEVNINEIKVTLPDSKITNTIELNPNYTLSLRYPSLSDIQAMTNSPDTNQADILFEIMTVCIDSVFSSDGNILKLKDFTREEVTSFIDSFPSDAIKKIRDFFDNMPQIKIEKKYTLSDGTEKTFILQGLETFFI